MGIGVPEAEGAHVHTYLGRPDVDEEQFDIYGFAVPGTRWWEFAT